MFAAAGVWYLFSLQFWVLFSNMYPFNYKKKQNTSIICLL